jgi:hypothetical protein
MEGSSIKMASQLKAGTGSLILMFRTTLGFRFDISLQIKSLFSILRLPFVVLLSTKSIVLEAKCTFQVKG